MAFVKNKGYEAVETIVSQLKTHPHIGRFVRQMENADYAIRFEEVLPRAVNGGSISDFKDYVGDNPSFVTVKYNLQDAQATAAKHGLELNMIQLIAHELGHCYYRFELNRTKNSGMGDAQKLGVAWENFMRPNGPRRRCHDLNPRTGKCL